MTGSIKSSEIKLVETLIKVKFIQRGNKVFQYFIFESKNYPKAIRDSRYCIYDKLENKIKQLSLSSLEPSIFSFIERIDGEEKITLVFETKEETNSFKNYYFTLAGFISKNTGCLTCLHNKNNAVVFIECEKKNKIIPKSLKSCVLFKEEERLFKT